MQNLKLFPNNNKLPTIEWGNPAIKPYTFLSTSYTQAQEVAQKIINNHPLKS